LILKKTSRLVTGITLVLVGIVGLILPVMPGWIFLIPGLIILADFFPPIRRLLDWAKSKDPRQRGPEKGASSGPAFRQGPGPEG